MLMLPVLAKPMDFVDGTHNTFFSKDGLILFQRCLIVDARYIQSCGSVWDRYYLLLGGTVDHKHFLLCFLRRDCLIKVLQYGRISVQEWVE